MQTCIAIGVAADSTGCFCFDIMFSGPKTFLGEPATGRLERFELALSMQRFPYVGVLTSTTDNCITNCCCCCCCCKFLPVHIQALIAKNTNITHFDCPWRWELTERSRKRWQTSPASLRPVKQSPPAANTAAASLANIKSKRSIRSRRTKAKIGKVRTKNIRKNLRSRPQRTVAVMRDSHLI